ncbi:MAG: hypothetical protein EZS28_043939 [Streblomastix strix]|uniref:Reverse transcriptase domain-containing protein n=1 Tax=Streblomastix strix TaxID=222440 RepID=A0A5J4TRJ1_9EUKA|nr:MAG: hypothetical protein EZS28_043939 [Streblomastix strix]
MGGYTARYLEQWETINMKDFIQQGFTLLWKDNLSTNNLQRQLETIKFSGTEEETKEYKIMLEEELKEKIVIPIKKEQNKLYNPTFMIMKTDEEWRKILDANKLNKQIADFHFKMHDSNEVNKTIRLGEQGTSFDLSSAFHHLIVQAVSQPFLAFEFQNNHYNCRAMLFGYKHSPIYFTTVMQPKMQQIRMKTEIRIINYGGHVLQLHSNKQNERDRNEINRNLPGIRMESNKCNRQNEIEEAFISPARNIQHEKIDKDRNKNISEAICQFN